MMDAEVHVQSPFPLWAVPRVYVWMDSFRDRVCDDNAPQSVEAWVQAWREKAEHWNSWGVWANGSLGGLVVLEPLEDGAANTHCIFKREFWGRSITERSLDQIYRQAFEAGVTEIRSMVFKDNKAIIALSKRLGARTKALFFEMTKRNGKPVDMYLLVLSKEDFYVHRSIGKDRADRRLGVVGDTREHKSEQNDRNESEQQFNKHAEDNTIDAGLPSALAGGSAQLHH